MAPLYAFLQNLKSTGLQNDDGEEERLWKSQGERDGEAVRRVGFQRCLHSKTALPHSSGRAVFVNISDIFIDIVYKLIGQAVFLHGIADALHFPAREFVQVGEEGVRAFGHGVHPG